MIKLVLLACLATWLIGSLEAAITLNESCEERCHDYSDIGVGVCSVIGGIMSAAAATVTGGVGAGVGAGLTAAICSVVDTASNQCGVACKELGGTIATTLDDIKAETTKIQEKIDKNALKLDATHSLLHRLDLQEDLDKLNAMRIRFNHLNLKFSKKSKNQKNLRRNFYKNAIDVHNGLFALISIIGKKINGKRAMVRKSIWKVDSSMCKKGNLDYFNIILTDAYKQLGFAYGMKKGKVSKEKNNAFEKIMIDIQSQYIKDCNCPKGLTRGNRKQNLVKILGFTPYADKIDGLMKTPKFTPGNNVAPVVTMDTYNKMMKISQKIRKFDFNSNAGIFVKSLPWEDIELLVKLKKDKRGNNKRVCASPQCPPLKRELNLDAYTNSLACYKKRPLQYPYGKCVAIEENYKENEQICYLIRGKENCCWAKSKFCKNMGG